MTNTELAELRGEIYGLKILLFNCISFIAGQADDPVAHLDQIQEHAVFGIAQAAPSNIRPAHLDGFRAAAAGIVVQAVEAAKEAVSRTEQPPTRQ